MIALVFNCISINAQSFYRNEYQISQWGVYIFDRNFNLTPIHVNNTSELSNPAFNYIGYEQFENVLFFTRVWDNWASLAYDFITDEVFEIDMTSVNFIRFITQTNLIINGDYHDLESRQFNQLQDIRINFEKRNTDRQNIGHNILRNENEGIQELYSYGTIINENDVPLGEWGKIFSINLFDRNFIFNCGEIYPRASRVEFYAIYNITHDKYIILVWWHPGK